MPFKKGQPKIGGRKAGTPNKSSLKLEERLAIAGFDVLEEMITLARTTEVDAVRAKILTHISEMIYPKISRIEHSGEINNPYLNKTAEELEVLVKEKLKK